MKTWKIYLLYALIFVLLIGCETKNESYQSKNDYSFNDLDIIAYVNGKPIYSLEKEQYITMKRSYYTAVVEASNSKVDDIHLDAYSEMLEKSFDVPLLRMETMVSYSDDKWDRDYYKTFVIIDKLYEYVDDINEYEAYLDETTDAAVQYALSSTGIESFFNGTSINKHEIFKNVAEKYNLSLEDFANTIYRAYIRSEIAYDSLMIYYGKYEYTGTHIKWDETNTEEYIEYLYKIYKQFDEYVEDLLIQAEIVERP